MKHRNSQGFLIRYLILWLKSFAPVVRIEVLGGVAYVEEAPSWVRVEIVDHDISESYLGDDFWPREDEEDE